jgi:hypothetical protein
LGSVKFVNGIILIDDIFLFEQKVTGTSTDLSQEDISKFMCEYLKQGKDTYDLKFWWHSHVNMKVFWSGTDTSTIDRFSSDWLISMVSNKKGEFKLRVDIFEPFRLTIDDLPYNVEDHDKIYYATVKKEIDAKVKQFPFMSEIRSMMAPNPQLQYTNKDLVVPPSKFGDVIDSKSDLMSKSPDVGSVESFESKRIAKNTITLPDDKITTHGMNDISATYVEPPKKNDHIDDMPGTTNPISYTVKKRTLWDRIWNRR